MNHKAVLAAGWALALALSPLAVQEPAKKPRVRPQQTITVKVYPEAHYQAKAKGAGFYLSTVTDFTCTAWVPAGAKLDDELAAYKACVAALEKANGVP